jgi:hypothetical protein
MNPVSLPIGYHHASNVIIFLNGLLIVVLIALSNWDKYRHFNAYSLVAGDEGNAHGRGEESGLMDHRSQAVSDLPQEKNWSEVLNRNVENFVPFFLTTLFIRQISFAVLSPTNTQFQLTIYAFLAFQYAYLAARLCHMIGYFNASVKFLRWGGFGVTAVVNALLGVMAIIVTFTGAWTEEQQVNGPFLSIACKAASVIVFVLVIKIHTVLFVTYKVKYYDENLLFAARYVFLSHPVILRSHPLDWKTLPVTMWRRLCLCPASCSSSLALSPLYSYPPCRSSRRLQPTTSTLS